MKIAVASDDRIQIANHFGRTKGFLIYSVENGNIKNKEYITNTFTEHAHGHHHHEHHHHSHAPILEALKDSLVVISRGMGRRLLLDLAQEGKEVFITEAVYADDAIGQFLVGELSHNPDHSCSH